MRDLGPKPQIQNPGSKLELEFRDSGSGGLSSVKVGDVVACLQIHGGPCRCFMRITLCRSL